MHILGELIQLPDRASHDGFHPLPLPWWVRAPLGLQSNTNVYVSIVRPRQTVIQSGRRSHAPSPVGELMVSVINPTRDLLHIQCKKPDRQGVMHDVFKALQGHRLLNIALAEGVTVDHRGHYQVSLVCELLDKQVVEWDGEGAPKVADVRRRESEVRKLAVKIQRQLRKDKFSGWDGGDPEVTFQPAFSVIRWCQTRTIVNGLIQKCDWHECLTKFVAAEPAALGYDYTQAVVSADTAKRVARFVFPRRGAVTITIEHADTPGALRMLTDRLRQKGLQLNLLSTLLRRGGVGTGNAMLVAVCEPPGTSDRPAGDLTAGGFEQIKAQIAAQLSKVPPMYAAKWRVTRAREWEKTLYIKHPDDIGVRVPSELRPVVQQVQREELHSSLVPVFLSRRFVGRTHRGDSVLQRVRLALASKGCQPVEASPKPGTPQPTIYQVESRLWACKYGIVLVMKLGEDDSIQELSMNLAHEYGFISGQGKPVVFLVQNSLREKIAQQLSNLQGLVTATFADGDQAFDDAHPESVFAKVKGWLDTVLPPRRMPD